MLRMLRIVGVVLFTFLVGLSANSLMEMHESGVLLEKYNSQRKADITLLVFSFIALGGLGYFELDRFNRASRRRTYADGPVSEERFEQTAGLDSTSIYAAPQTVDKWEGRRTRGSKSRHKTSKEIGYLWLSLLKVICIFLPLSYLGLMVFNLLSGRIDSRLNNLLLFLFGGLLLLSLVTLVGVMAKKSWGLSLGYILALCNLLIFPIGTVFGLFLMIGLVGASPIFAEVATTRRREQRRRRADPLRRFKRT